MRHVLHRRRPSAAMLVAIAALIVASSGTAVAAGALAGGDSLIKKNSLSGNRLRNRSVLGSKIKLSSLGTVPSAVHAASADTATSATSAGAAPIAKVTYVANQTAIPVGTGTPVLVTASCPAGTAVTGGGASVSDQQNGQVNDSYPNGRTGWAADIFGGSAPITATVTAICAPAAATAP
jgi:hypothetical protein